MRHIFVVNPVAGKGSHVVPLIRQIEEVCREKGADYTIYTTQSVDDATRYVREMSGAGGELRFYACGGDGTLAEVARGAYGYPNVQVAVVPCGSGNDFVRSFPGVPFGDIAAQLAGDARRIDLIQTGKGLCINLCSVGFDSAVALSMVRYKNIPLITGSMAYILAIAERFFRHLSNPLTITADGKTLPAGEYVMGVCANGCCYGGGFAAAPRARLDDGLLELVMVKRLSRARFLLLVGKYKKGMHLDDPAFADVIIYRRAKTIEITSSKQVVVNYDGECEIAEGLRAEILP
ncbi:MAG: diacylglycerol kinase family protein, partial [Acetanaerobacterium sp.]